MDKATFLSKIRKSGPNKCWVWKGKILPSGHGRYTRRDQMAHRVSYQLHKGKIPKGKLLRHTCDNPPCVNPRHLVPGTIKQNVQDRVSRGRQIHGSKIGTSKLKEAQVKSIRSTYSKGGTSQSAIAEKYHVSQPTVGLITRGVQWKDEA
jgi:hypothetical protein